MNLNGLNGQRASTGNSLAGTRQTTTPKLMASPAAKGGNGDGSLGQIPTDQVTLGGGLSPEMQDMNRLRQLAGRFPTLRDTQQNQRFKAQGECVRASGKSAEEIGALSTTESGFHRFQSDISLCTDARMMINDVTRDEAIKDRGGVAALYQGFQDIMMQ